MRCLAIVLGLFLFSQQLASQVPPVRFRDIGTKSGLTTYPHFSKDKRYLIETMGGGVALFDCDNDGKLEIAVTGDSTINGYLAGGDPMVTLYHQDPNFHFTDITQSAGLVTKGWGMGIAIGDYDNDGLPDMYVTGYRHNVLYHNLGGCKFEDVTEKTHLAGGGFSVGAAWADYDHDGHLDLFVARYVHSDILNLSKPGMKSFDYKGAEVEVPEMEGETNLLFHNRGDGTFEEVSEKAGVNDPDKRLGMGVVWADYDNDGWPDLFVANDMGPNFLYHNKHNGTFEDVGMETGVALGIDGKALGNMAADFGDFDRDGNLDMVITRYGYQPMSLLWYQKGFGYADFTTQSKIERTSYRPVRWGTGFADFDNDGWPDVLIANGNIAPILDTLPHELKYREPIQLFRNSGNLTFEDIAEKSGINDGELQSRRGVAFGDINDDGYVDAVVYNVGGPPSLFLNETKNKNHRVLFRLITDHKKNTVIGTRVTVITSKMRQIDEVRGGGSYLSSSDQRLHFGLGAESEIKSVVIQWSSGSKETLKDIAADMIYTVVEGKGIVEMSKFAGSPK